MNIIRRSLYQFSVSKFNASKDYYKILGVTLGSNEKQIKTAFRKLAKQYHPDSTNGNQQKFKEVNEAYQVLSEQSIKNQYDEARAYYAQSTQSRNPNSSQYPNQGSNYSNGQYHHNENFHPNYQRPNQSSQYRGYTRDDGWQNQRYRQQVMNEVFKQYQRNRSQYGTFEDMYKQNQENIRQYTDQIKRRQQTIRKAFQAQQLRKQQEWKEYQDKRMQDLQAKMAQKMGDMKEGFIKNINGIFKVGSFLKDTIKNVADTVVKNMAKDQRDDKKDKNKKK